MNDEEQKNLWQSLKCAWQEHKPSNNPALTADQQITAIRKKMAKLHRGLEKTDFWGSALYAVVAVPFLFYVFTTPYPVARIGYLIIIGGMLFASLKSIWRMRSISQPIADAPVMEWLKYDLAKVRQHAEDSRTLVWWYLLPFVIGMTVSTCGMPGGGSGQNWNFRDVGPTCRRHLLAEPTGVAQTMASHAAGVGSVVARGVTRRAAGGAIYGPCSNHRLIRASAGWRIKMTKSVLILPLREISTAISNRLNKACFRLTLLP